MLDNGHDQVEAHHHLHRPPGQEHSPDPRGPGKVQLVTKSWGQPEIVNVTLKDNFILEREIKEYIETRFTNCQIIRPDGRL